MLGLTQFTAFAKAHALFTANQQILLAVSGGKDSVLMAHLFKQAGLRFGIAHCNFNLRGEESQRDEAFVKLLASSLEVPFYVSHFDTEAYATQAQISIQMAARDLRYQWFEKVRTAHDYAFIAVAQHQNDALETVLLNLTRGTGISGMHGILPKRGNIIRPLLFLSRQEIDAIVAAQNFDFVADSSNESSKYARNKIRLEVVPLLQEINPNFTQTFAQNIARFSQTEEVLQQMVDQVRAQIEQKNGLQFKYEIAAVAHLKPQQLLMFELLKPFNFTYLVVEELLKALHKQSGTSFYSTTHRLTVDRKELIVSPLATLKEETVFLNLEDKALVFRSQKISVCYTSNLATPSTLQKAHVDFEQLIFPLAVRVWQKGDKFIPLGMRGHKKLSDFFIDAKIPLPEKEALPILVNGNGEIIWIAGLRQDNRYKVVPSTKKVAIFELTN